MITQWVRRTSAIVALLLLGTGLAACIQDSGGIGGDLAGGGIGGTGNGGVGFGEITGFGSILFNDDSIFETDEDTEFFIDGEPVENEDAFKGAFGITDDSGEPVGAVAIVEVRNDVNADFTQGTAARVDARTAIKGPVTSNAPLQILGQTIIVTGTTVLADLPNGIGSLIPGDQVEVSGFTEQNNNVLASRLQRRTGGLDEWKLTGFVTARSTNSFNVGGQIITLNGGPEVRDCGSSIPQIGQFVEVKAEPDSGFSPGASLIASDVECKPRGLSGELDDSGVNLRRVQGFISETGGDLQGTGGTLTIGGTGTAGQVVQLTANTVFTGGTRVDLGIGVRVEITGQFNAATGVLTASRVSFREARVRIEATLEPGNVDPEAGTLTLLGITVHRLPTIEDDDNFFGGGMPARDVRMRGYVDRDGTVYATEIEDRDDPGDRDLRLRGPVDAGSISEPTFSILGVQINPGAGTLFKDNDDIIDQGVFFGALALTPGHPVQVDEGTFNPNGPSIDNPSEIELED